MTEEQQKLLELLQQKEQTLMDLESKKKQLKTKNERLQKSILSVGNINIQIRSFEESILKYQYLIDYLTEKGVTLPPEDKVQES